MNVTQNLNTYIVLLAELEAALQQHRGIVAQRAYHNTAWVMRVLETLGEVQRLTGELRRWGGED